MPPKDGGFKTRSKGYGETVGVGRHSHAAKRWRVQNSLYGIWRNGRHRAAFPYRKKINGLSLRWDGINQFPLVLKLGDCGTVFATPHDTYPPPGKIIRNIS